MSASPQLVQYTSKHAEDEMRVVNAIREMREEGASGVIEVKFQDGGICGTFLTKTKRIK